MTGRQKKLSGCVYGNLCIVPGWCVRTLSENYTVTSLTRHFPESYRAAAHEHRIRRNVGREQILLRATRGKFLKCKFTLRASRGTIFHFARTQFSRPRSVPREYYTSREYYLVVREVSGNNEKISGNSREHYLVLRASVRDNFTGRPSVRSAFPC